MVRKRVTIENYMKAQKMSRTALKQQKTVRFNEMIPCQAPDFPLDT